MPTNSHDYTAGFHTGVRAVVEILQGRARINDIERAKKMSVEDYTNYSLLCATHNVPVDETIREEKARYQVEMTEVQESIERNLVSLTDRLDDWEKNQLAALTTK